MKATVIMNTYNEKPHYLIASIEAYLSQRGVDMQVIVSTVSDDKNMAYLKSMPVDLVITPREKHPGHSPEGSFMQLNAAIPSVNGDFVCFGSSNDLPIVTKIANEAKRCVKGKLVCYSDFYLCYTELNKKGRTNVGAYDINKHMQGNYVSDCALVQTELFKKYTPFRWEQWGNFSYWDLWLRIYKGEGNVFAYNPKPTWYYRQYGGMHTKGRPDDYKKQRQRMIESHL